VLQNLNNVISFILSVVTVTVCDPARVYFGVQKFYIKIKE